MTSEWLNTTEICVLVGISYTTAWRMKRDGLWIPEPPVQLRGVQKWSRLQVDAWLKARSAGNLRATSQEILASADTKKRG